MYVGIVKWFDTKKGYGFITSNTVDYFVHFSEIVSNRDFKTLNDGDEVEFEPSTGGKGMVARNVKVIDPVVV